MCCYIKYGNRVRIFKVQYFTLKDNKMIPDKCQELQFIKCLFCKINTKNFRMSLHHLTIAKMIPKGSHYFHFIDKGIETPRSSVTG